MFRKYVEFLFEIFRFSDFWKSGNFEFLFAPSVISGHIKIYNAVANS